MLNFQINNSLKHKIKWDFGKEHLQLFAQIWQKNLLNSLKPLTEAGFDDQVVNTVRP